MIKEPKNAENFLMLIKYLLDHKASFDAKNEPKDLTSNEAKSEAKK